MGGSPWDSLEVAKLAVGILTPLLLLGLGFVVNRAARRVEEAQWGNRKLVERRLALYDEMAPLLNDLYCFFALVGHFRDVDPAGAVSRKRQVDKLFFVNEFLFSAEFKSRYQAFVKAAYEHFVGVGMDARLRVDPDEQRLERGESAPAWNDDWDELFSPPEERRDRETIMAAHKALMESFAAELGVPGREQLALEPERERG